MNYHNSLKSIALIGNPNTGKSTLFNILTGGKQQIGNFAGVTVNITQGTARIKQQKYHVFDLPGIYQCQWHNTELALDQQLTQNYLQQQNFDLIINVINATELQRQLALTLQLRDLGYKMIVVLNMADELSVAPQHLAELLAKELNCIVIPMMCNKRVGLPELKAAIFDTMTQCTPNLPISNNSNNDTQHDDYQAQLQYILRTNTIMQHLEANLARIRNTRQTLTQYVDKILLHRSCGLPLFLVIMYLVFELAVNVGNGIKPLFEGSALLSANFLTHGVNYLLPSILPNKIMTFLNLSLSGLAVGLKTVCGFIPQLLCLFFLLNFLEDTGYISRAAFIVDRIMHSIGLPGQAFLPLFLGFGCNVTGVMAARTLDQVNCRILTILLTPFMTCGARLAIFMVFASAFFPSHAGGVVFLLYTIGLLAAIITGLILKKTIFKSSPHNLVLELPNYHVPNLRHLCSNTYMRLTGFVWRAGKIIVPTCIIFSIVQQITVPFTYTDAPDKQPPSLLQVASQGITPILAPIGMTKDNWQATVGLFTGAIAKEVVLATLNSLYQPELATNTNDNNVTITSMWQDTATAFRELLSWQNLNPFAANIASTDVALGSDILTNHFRDAAAAFAYCVFVLLYLPCISTYAAIAREIGKFWARFSLAWSTSIAYTCAILCYQLLTFMQHKITSFILINICLLFQLGMYLSLRKHRYYFLAKINLQSQSAAPSCNTGCHKATTLHGCHAIADLK